MSGETPGQAAYEAHYQNPAMDFRKLSAPEREHWEAVGRSGHDAVLQALRAELEGLVTDWREGSRYRPTDTRDEITEGAAVRQCADSLAAILGEHPGPQPAPEVAEAMAALAKVAASHERVMYAALIEVVHGDAQVARQFLEEQLDGFDGPQWNGTETGEEWLERTRDAS